MKKKRRSLSEKINKNAWVHLEDDLESVVNDIDLIFNHRTKRLFVQEIFWGLHTSLNRNLLGLTLGKLGDENPEHRRKRLPAS